MSWLALAWANLRHAPLSSAINVFLLALGTASIAFLLLVSAHFSRVISRDAQGIDLVVGAKGSPIQLVLASVYHADIPTGNIREEDAHRWANDPRVERAVPLSLGDSYRGFRIVGTTPDYASIYSIDKPSAGQFWTAPMQAVVGAAVTREAGLNLGDTFAGAHGLEASADHHDDAFYTVTGLLPATGTVLDRLILTSLDSVWALHEEHEEHEEHEDREITALLLQYASPLAAMSLPREINTASPLQAAAPAFELTRLLQLVGVGLDGLVAFAGVLILTAAFSIFGALYAALKARRFDLAMLRCLGATREELFWSLLLEGLLLTFAGIALGLILGHGAMVALGHWLESSRGVAVEAGVWLMAENWLVLGLLGVGLFAAALPAWQAYRTDVAQTLAAN